VTKRGINISLTLPKNDIASLQVRREQLRQRYQDVLDGMLAGVLPPRR
jgi:hypothetical protein